MKKYILILITILILMTTLTGCGEESEIPLAAVIADGDVFPVYIENYEKTGDTHGWFREHLNEVKDQIPVITYREGMSLVVSDGLECWGISAYDTSGQYINGISDLSMLTRLNGGEYYFRAYVLEKHGDEIQEYNDYNCVFRMTIPDLDPLLTVISGGKETAAPKYSYCCKVWNESEYGSGWLLGDDSGIYEKWEETCGKLPEVQLGEDFSLRSGENATLNNGCAIYDENYERIGWLENHEELNTLGSGTYYVVVHVFRHDTEIHEGETGYEGYHCGFKLIVS